MEKRKKQTHTHKTQSQRYTFAVKSSVVLPYVDFSLAVSRTTPTENQSSKGRNAQTMSKGDKNEKEY